MIHKILTITGQQARLAACKAIMNCAEGLVFTISDPHKSRDQEALYHVLIGEIAKSYLFCGRYWDREDMKRLLIDQFRRDTKHDPELKPYWDQIAKIDMAPSLDGSGVVALGVQSRKFPKKVASAFIEWLNVWMAENLEQEVAA